MQVILRITEKGRCTYKYSVQDITRDRPVDCSVLLRVDIVILGDIVVLSMPIISTNGLVTDLNKILGIRY